MDSADEKGTKKTKRRQQSHTLPTTDADMLQAGTSFLDAIEKTLGLGYVLCCAGINRIIPSLVQNIVFLKLNDVQCIFF